MKEAVARGTKQISWKQSVEIASMIRGKKTETAKKMLEKVIKMEMPVKFKRFNESAGHRSGIGPGKYPVKASHEILQLLKSAEANAQHQGISNSKITHIITSKCSTRRYGRQGWKGKRTYIEVKVGND
ncbi:50S ribosomal protein L22 [Candidatus Woesearchaeota archaeon]|nr:50S ribosomal protein L22 [Candidatus Woesearchaeota archaeon]